MFEISYLRILGVVLCIPLFIGAFVKLRRPAKSRIDVLLAFLSGLTLLAISLFPSLANFPSEVLDLDEAAGGRIITLLLIATAFLWLLVFRERSKRAALELKLDRVARTTLLQAFLQQNDVEKIKPDSICLVMPALNEAENLHAVLPKIPREIQSRPVVPLVIDDGSTDGTAAVAADHGALVMSNPTNMGGGAALRLGYDIAAMLRASVIVTMDADGQHDPADIPALVQPILDKQADGVIGSRVIGSREKDSIVRWIGVHTFNRVINAITGEKITDCSSGFRAFDLSRLLTLRLIQDQFHTAELIIEAAKQGLRITEQPITIRRRLHGRSKKGANLGYGLNFLRSILKTWIR